MVIGIKEKGLSDGSIYPRTERMELVDFTSDCENYSPCPLGPLPGHKLWAISAESLMYIHSADLCSCTENSSWVAIVLSHRSIPPCTPLHLPKQSTVWSSYAIFCFLTSFFQLARLDT